MACDFLFLRITAKWVNTKRFRYLVVRYRVQGLNTQSRDYFIWLNDGSLRFVEALSVLSLSDLKGNVQWHFAFANLQASDIRPYFSDLALQVQATEPNCEVVVGEIAFRDGLPVGAIRELLLPLLPYREQPLPLSTLAKLQAQPTWLANPIEKATLSVTPEGLRHLKVFASACPNEILG